MSKLRQLKERRAALYANICDVQKQFDGKEMDAEARSNFQKLVNDVHELDAQITTEERLMEIQSRSAEQNVERERNERKADGDAEIRAFAKYLLGMDMNQEERGLLKRSIDGVAGNVLIPSSLAASIEKALVGKSAMLGAVDIIRSTSGGDLVLPTNNDSANRAQIIDEYGESQIEKVSFNSVTLKAYTYRTPIIAMSYELLQDSAYNVQAYISELLADRFAAGLNQDLTNGTGVGMPQGITVAAKKVSLSGEGIIYDDLVALRKAIKSSYHGASSFMMSTATECDLMLMKDGNDRPLWLPSMREGAPATILGKPVVINDDMADGSVIFGDLKKYKARIVKDFSVKVLNESLAKWLSVGVMGFGRADGKLLDAGTNPIAILSK